MQSNEYKKPIIVTVVLKVALWLFRKHMIKQNESELINTDFLIAN